MIERKTVIDQIEINRSGVVQLRFGLLVIEDGKEISCNWHRTAIEPGGDADAQVSAVNDHLAMMGESPISADDAANIKPYVTLAHRPEVVAAHQQKVAARRTEREARDAAARAEQDAVENAAKEAFDREVKVAVDAAMQAHTK